MGFFTGCYAFDCVVLCDGFTPVIFYMSRDSTYCLTLVGPVIVTQDVSIVDPEICKLNLMRRNNLNTLFISSFLIMLTLFNCKEVKDNDLTGVRVDKDRIPHLEKHGTAVRLVADGKPFLLISGELHNSTCGGLDYMRPVWKRMKEKNLNSVIASVSWELVEPEQGKYDFSLVDSIIYGAQKENLKLILIWFGSWKNSGSIYIPSWVKKDFEKYLRVKDESGKPLEILSTFSSASSDADAEAYAALMRHIREVDGSNQTVVMMQVENEMGILDNRGIPGKARRDFNEAASASYNSQVPEELIKYLTDHKETLFPELYRVWSANGFKTQGNWEEIFGKSEFRQEKADWQFYSFYTEELFMAWNYAKYTEKVASKGKLEYPLPMFVNAWLKQPSTGWPGKYPSGGPLPQVIDIWRAAAPSIDFISPDIYIDEFIWVCKEFTQSGNPLFIPETRGGEAGAARALYVFGEFSAGLFAPFGIDNDNFRTNDPLDEVYAVLQNISPAILEHQGMGTMRGILVDTLTPSIDFDLGEYNIQAVLAGGKNPGIAGGIVIQTGSQDYLIAGRNLDIFFLPKDSTMRAGIDAADEGIFKEGVWHARRRLNGDETHASTYDGTGLRFTDQINIQKVSLYRYK